MMTKKDLRPYKIPQGPDRLVVDRETGEKIGHLRVGRPKFKGMPRVTQWEAWATATEKTGEERWLGYHPTRVAAAEEIWRDYRREYSLGFALGAMTNEGQSND